MLAVFFRYAVGRVRRYFARERAARIITLGAFVVVLGFFAFEMYVAFRYGFRAIARNAFLEEALLLYVIELFALVSFLLLAASALMSGLWALFRPNSDMTLMASPRYTLKPWLAFGRVFLLASWPLFLVMLPAFGALGETYRMSIGGATIAIGAMLAMTATAILFSFITIIFLAHVLLVAGRIAHKALLSRGTLAVLALVTYGIFLAAVADRFASMSLVRFFQARILEVDVPHLEPIFSMFRTLPSHPAAEVLFRTATGNIAEAVVPLAVLAVMLAALLGMLLALSRSFLPLWQALHERARGGLFVGKPALSGMLARVQGAGMALVAKEAIAFARNGKGMLWLFFIFLIWLIEVGASQILARHLEDERVAAGGGGIVEMIALATIIYFASIIVLRFVFPSFSSERSTAWVIRSAPVDLFRSYVAKFVFFSIVTSLLAFFFALLNLSVAGITSFMTSALLYFYVIIAACFVAAFGLSLGAMFPNTETDDPELLSTTLPGLAFIGGVILYGAVASVLFRSTLSSGISSLFVFLALSLLFTAFLIARSRRALLRPLE